MEHTENITHGNAFYRQLFLKALPTIILVSILGLIVVGLPQIIAKPLWIKVVVVLALIKSFFIVRLSFNQLSKIIGQSHLLSHVLVLFGLLITLIVLSFAMDYLSIYLFDGHSFKIGQTDLDSTMALFFEFLYFSLITFSSVGYGDVVPLSFEGKFLAMLEIVLSFFVLVFGIANINRIHVGEEKDSNNQNQNK
ncbi:MAG: metal transporter [Muricauda sp.]|nr:potassium channel family protein [Allomuricauda sp.]MAU15823.1 metal transporter [Allomuricauda sp.]MBC32191.1 metal transporter [Allomuricauda sp.]|tara:strand:- start:5402 stop:5983 length:582 start_codon:yes stop_codon:yes gene_type:complete